MQALGVRGVCSRDIGAEGRVRSRTGIGHGSAGQIDGATGEGEGG